MAKNDADTINRPEDERFLKDQVAAKARVEAQQRSQPVPTPPSIKDQRALTELTENLSGVKKKAGGSIHAEDAVMKHKAGHSHHSDIYGKYAAGHTKHKEHVLKNFRGK